MYNTFNNITSVDNLPLNAVFIKFYENVTKE